MNRTNDKKDFREDALKAGTMLLDKYRLDSLISASGGTSFLYLATDLKRGDLLAVKELYPKGICNREGTEVKRPADAQAMTVYRSAYEMFVSESNLMRSLNGERIAPEIHDVLYENGTVYLVMEFIDGESLRDYLKKNGQMTDPQIALQIISPVFKTLMRLHARNIIHRDISPDNILICRDATVRLIDFGNAHPQETGKSRIIDWAKKSYAPIEQTDAQFRQGAWTDVYALAATIYRMLCGEAPPAAKERAIRDTARSFSEIAPMMSADRQQALTRALAVYPEKRFQTMADFFEALYPEGPTVPARTQEEETVPGAKVAERDAGDKPAQYEGWVIGLEGQHRDREYRIEDNITFGRASGCSIRFAQDTPGVSGIHLLVRFDTEKLRFAVTDVGSTYGTRYLNGAPMVRQKETWMKEGEGFILGDHEIFACVVKPM